MKAIFHAHGAIYPKLKELQFTHTEISVNAWPGNYLDVATMYRVAKKQGLHAIIDPGLLKDTHQSLALLRELPLTKDDMIYLPDEANIKGIAPNALYFFHKAAKAIHPDTPTIATMSWIKPFQDYANCADIIAPDYYRHYKDLWSLAVFTYRVLRLKMKHKGKIVGVPAIRYGADHITKQQWYWQNILGVKDLFWYSWSLDGGKWDPNDSGKSLTAYPDWQTELIY